MAPDFAEIPRVPWRRAPVLLLLYAGAVAALSWPWLASAGTCVVDHWDPPFHAWKLAYAAKALLAGHILPPGGDTNLYYPNSGAFYYEALHWPQALFAAPLLAAGLGPVATYNVTMLFFWALPGVCFWAFLRAIGLGGGAAALGGLFYTAAPWRIAYLPEFNMQLVFGLPLMLFAIARFFQRPGFRYALLGAVAWWLQATSELYQAVFIVLAMPLLATPLLARDPALLRSGRRLWAPLLLATAICAALALPMLWPYAETLGDGTLTRSLEEMSRHALDPFSYLLPWGRFRLLPMPKTLNDETSAYPTLALLAAATAGVASVLRRRRREFRRRDMRALVASIAATALLLLAWHRPGAGAAWGEAASFALAATMFAAIAALPRRGRGLRAAIGAGLAATALFGFAMSLGPFISDAVAGEAVPNRLFLLVRGLCPALAGFRVMSRFSLFPFASLCAAAAWGADCATRQPAIRHAAPRVLATLAFLAAFLAECVPPGKIRMRPVRDVSASPALAALDTRAEPFVLAIVPMGLRDLDSEHMLTIERADRLGVWAWGGTYPPWTKALGLAMQPSLAGDSAKAAGLLRELWPEALVLEDRRPFPGIRQFDWQSWFAPFTETIADDAEFRLLRLVPDTTPNGEHVRLVRRDLAIASPVARFTLAATDAPARIWLDLNGIPLGSWETGARPRECAITIPAALLVRHLPERFRFHAVGDVPFGLISFRLGGEGGAPEEAMDPGDAPELPWLNIRRSLPPGAVPVDIRYPGGLTVAGAERLDDAPDGSGIRLRLWLSLGNGASHAPNVALSPGFARNGSIVFQHPTPALAAASSVPWGVVGERHLLFAADVPLPWPDLFKPGETADITLDVKSPRGKRLNGRDNAGRKIRHASLGMGAVAPEPQAIAGNRRRILNPAP